ncbi:MarR family winged helix-turn-helix transcriptional regulator [Nocardia sp. CA-084685]|uniref:MarR family winged helix-turn-helix transcriptional regulator n=1 Tax=Nocardia sp. CA-084685 TaxID=3239970 RepID=UPI003D97F673
MEVTDSVWRIIRALDTVTRLQRRAAAAGPYGQVALGLLNLAAQGAVRPSDAAAELGVPAQSISRAVGQLISAGLIRQVGSRTDGRSYSVEVTDAGTEARARFRAELTESFGAHLDSWTPTEITEFTTHLERLVRSLSADARVTRVRRPAGPKPWRTAT